MKWRSLEDVWTNTDGAFVVSLHVESTVSPTTECLSSLFQARHENTYVGILLADPVAETL